ncbi:MAG: cytochrome c biogenesis protein CcdA [Thermoleophilia bacterium]|nr:cytochrome c biogenesis protein CcdA [Thermoleophilia bacterium]
MEQITEVSLIAFFWAFLAGLASFLSPCVLPLLPGYLSYVSGVGVDELGTQTRKVALASTAFVVGFVTLFSVQGAALGLAGSSIGDFLSFWLSDTGQGRRILELIAGVVFIAFGILAMGLINPAFFQRERRMRLLRKPASLVGVVLAGMLFSIGIGPCTGPLLGSIYTLAIGTQDPGAGASLLFVYAMGMGVPFVASGFLFTRMIGTYSVIKRHFRVIKIASGIILIAFGFLLLSGQINNLSNWLQWLPSLTQYS